MTIQQISYKSNNLGHYSIEKLGEILERLSLKVLEIDSCTLKKQEDLNSLILHLQMCGTV